MGAISNISKLAQSNSRKAYELTQRIEDPWFRAQTLAWVARFTTDDSVAMARHAAKAAEQCADDY